MEDLIFIVLISGNLLPYISAALNDTGVRFTKEPMTSYTTLGEPVILQYCNLETTTAMDENQVKLLKDGYQVLTILRTEPFKDKNKWYYYFSQIEMRNTTLNNQGYYQCMVDTHGRKIFSRKAYVQFQDVFTTKVTLQWKNRVYTEEYQNRSSSRFKTLEKDVNDIIKRQAKASGLLKDDDSPYIKVMSISQGSVVVEAEILLSGQTEENKNDRCKINLLPIHSNDLTIRFENPECCQKEEVGSKDYKGRYTYESILAGRYDNQTCKYSTHGKTTSRHCIKNVTTGAYWGKPDLLLCPAKDEVTNELLELKKKLSLYATPLQKSMDLNRIINSSERIQISEDVGIISSIISHIVNNDNFNVKTIAEVSDNILQVVNRVVERGFISENRANLEMDNLPDEPFSSILESTENLAKNIVDIIENNSTSSIDTVAISASQVGFQITRMEYGNNVTVTATNESSKRRFHGTDVVKVDISSQTKKIQNGLASFQASFNETQPSIIVSSYFYRKPTLFETNSAISRKKIGNILSVNIHRSSYSLHTPAVLNFSKAVIRKENELVESKCVYWETDYWSTDGCYLAEDTGDRVICKCTHLTNFGVMFDISQMQYNSLALSYITWIGCAISLAGLSLTILTYMIFRDLLHALPSKLLLNLSISLVLLLVTFLAGVEQTEPRIGCQIIASLIQYFILTTFSWMGIEAFNMYRSFVKVFDAASRNQSKFMKWSSCIAWGGSAIVVVITAISSFDNLGNTDFCILIGYSFYFGIALPVIIVLLFNAIVMIFVMVALTKRMNNTSPEQNNVMKQTKIVFSCSVLLGLTWIFGALAIKDLSVPFQWLFAIFNSLQGFFIFIFHTLSAADVRKAWSKWLSSKTDNKVPKQERKSLVEPSLETSGCSHYHNQHTVRNMAANTKL